MLGNQKFFHCKHCGNLLGLIDNKGVPLVCCGEKMVELVANSSGGNPDKHLPQVKTDGNKITVTVGADVHPMTDEHHIVFVYVETKTGGQRKRLEVGKEPSAEFCFVDDAPVSVFEYCNLHGLWRTDL